ncbi:CPBP family intramembrane glutamic endopeptidase [Aedoeadaptatus urinae]|uniref:CPBP family intramembrane glutamic endopeptidase n=1 Tax=Aedoeadaptatus urinae TaxID=1871017 RepID=UPI0009FB7119|nr:type II CAAX endopeptidase family protein [Peptoniphilus urinae]
MGRTTETNPISTPTRINSIALLWWCVLAGILFLLLGPILSRSDPLLGIVLTEAVAIFAPALIFRRNFPAKTNKGMGLAEAALLTVAVFPIILVINGIFLDALSRIYLLENQNLDLLRDAGLFKQILTVALAPAVMEEFFFRGVLCERFARRSPRGAVVLSAALFALFHFEAQNSLAPFLFGLVLGYIYLYGGLKACIFSHFLYNLSSILFIYFFNERWIASFSKTGLVLRLGGIKNATTVLLLLAGVIGVALILRASMKRPLPRGRKVLRRKEWIPVAVLAVIYVIQLML